MLAQPGQTAASARTAPSGSAAYLRSRSAGLATSPSSEAIVQKLEEKAGPEARKLFETFMRDVEKLQQEQKGG